MVKATILLMQRHPRVNLKKVVKKKRFNKSQVIFIKYLDAYELYDEVFRFRKKQRIHENGFTDEYQIQMWLEREGQGEHFDKQCLKFLAKHDLPHNFYNLLRDYVLTGFRLQLCQSDDNEAVCSLEETPDHYITPHYVLKVHDGAEYKDIESFIKQHKAEIEKVLKKQRRISLGKRPTTPKVHNRDLIVKGYKKLSKKELIEAYWFDEKEKENMLYGKDAKLTVIQKLLKKRHNITLSIEMIDKI